MPKVLLELQQLQLVVLKNRFSEVEDKASQMEIDAKVKNMKREGQKIQELCDFRAKKILQNKPMVENFGTLDLVTFESKCGLNLNTGTMECYLNAYSLTGYGLNDASKKVSCTSTEKFFGDKLHF
jgi:hypothetical protein